MKPLACVGIAVLDKIFQVDSLPSTGGKYVARGYREVGGGPAATAACAIARLAGSVQLMARIGDDASGRTVIDELAKYEVDTSRVHRIKGASTALSAVFVDDTGERMIVNYQDRSLDRRTSWMKKIDFAQFSAVLADVRWPEGAIFSLTSARRAGVPSMLDADVSPDDIAPMVALADHAVFSQPGLVRFTGTENIEQALRLAESRGSGRVYVTAGGKGCYWLENGALQHEPSHAVTVVDTTGAGDVFHGAMLLAIAEGRETRSAVRFACVAAALKCTKAGGRSGIPSRDEVDLVLGSRPHSVAN